MNVVLMRFFLKDFFKKPMLFPNGMKVVTLLKVFFKVLDNFFINKIIGCPDSVFNGFGR